MLNIGSYNELVVEREVDFGFYLNPKEDEVLLPSKYVPENTRPGDTLRVFVYTDSEDRPVATTLEPTAVVGEFACLTVKDLTPIGAFLDWGLEKDLLVPRNQQQERMQAGKKYVVKVCLDETTQRVYATTHITQNCDKNTDELTEGQKVRLLIYGVTKIGFMAVIENRCCGLLYKNETYETLSVGDKVDGYVTRIREDGKVDLTLKKPGYTSVLDSSEKIMTILAKSGGFVPCHDKSSPEEIKKIFSMSKKEFKRTIGTLYKNGRIDIGENGISLK